MKYAVWITIALLAVLHQDVWFWNDARLVFGFLPVSLAYHIALSLAAAAVWYLATIFAWPVDEWEVQEQSHKMHEAAMQAAEQEHEQQHAEDAG